MAQDLGISQGYFSRLHRVIDAITPVKAGELMKDWRTARAPLGIKEMETIAKQTTPDRILEAYTTQVAAKSGDVKPAEKDENAWKDRAKEQATQVGVTIGVLQSLGALDNGASIEWAAVIGDLHHAVKIKKGAEVKEVVEIARAAQAGFVFGLSKLAQEAAEEQKKDAEKQAAKIAKKNEKEDKKADGGSKKTASNGKEASADN